MNKLYYGDNLDVLRKFVRDETIDLCYIARRLVSVIVRNHYSYFETKVGLIFIKTME